MKKHVLPETAVQRRDRAPRALKDPPATPREDTAFHAFGPQVHIRVKIPGGTVQAYFCTPGDLCRPGIFLAIRRNKEKENVKK